MRVAFWGTPEVAVAALADLATAQDIEIAAVVTNPDRPRGRSRTPVAPPVKVAALEHGLPVLQPERPRTIVEDLDRLGLDACAVVAYGAILPKEVLATARLGFVNLHFSLLPRWRGAAPVQHAIRTGDAVTGVTTFVLDEGMDTGPLLRQVEVEIGAEETSGSLLDRLAAVGAPVLTDSLRDLANGAELVPQAREGTFAPKITSDDVRIDWTRGAREVADLVRSANPAPGAHTTFRGERLKVWLARPVADGAASVGPDAAAAAAPGSVVAATDYGVIVATGDGAVELTELQPAGKARMAGSAFANGYRPEPGEVLLADPETGCGA